MRNWRPAGRRGRRRRRRTAEVTGAYTRIGCCRRTMAAISISSGAARRSSNAPGLTAESAPPHTGGRNRLLRPPVLLPKCPACTTDPRPARSDGNQAPYMGLNCHLRRRPALFGATYTVPNTIPDTARFAFANARLRLLCVRNTGSHASIARAPKASEPALEHCRAAEKANLVGPAEAGGAAARTP